MTNRNCKHCSDKLIADSVRELAEKLKNRTGITDSILYRLLCNIIDNAEEMVE